MFKKILILIISIAITIASIIPVSAVYDKLRDNGVNWVSSDGGTFNAMSAGKRYSTCAGIYPYFSIEELKPDTTYTLTYTAVMDLDPTKAPTTSIYLNARLYYGETMPKQYPNTTISGAIISRTLEETESEGYYKYTYKLVFNTSEMTNLSTCYFIIKQSFTVQYLSLFTNYWGFSAQYDPEQSYYLEQIANDVSQIKQDNQNFYSNAPEIIKNALNDHDEDIKQEATSSGNDSIDQLTGALTDMLPITNIQSALSPLLDALSYTGTEAEWILPEIYIPAMEGVISRTQLTEEQPINFTEWISKVPDSLMTICRCITSITIIWYAIKEVMAIVEWAAGVKSTASAEEEQQ